ncbi:MAG: hypothetical protein IT453_19230 [Planctomycetes bacterium]|nr:hypothetical protein [Planctomycetota bacterium]
MSSSSARPTSATPWVWLVPLLGFALAALYWLERERTPLANRPPTIASPDEGVAGFSARATLAEGVLRVRLVPLHPDVARQRFDSLALAQRLELAAGEPWRLTLTLGEAQAPLELDTARLVVRDRSGDALVPLGRAVREERPNARRDDRPSDPLRTLVGAGVESLAPARSVDVVLWGRAPTDEPRLAGFVATTGVERPAAADARDGLALDRTVHRRAELETPLARLELSGKSTDARASSDPQR